MLNSPNEWHNEEEYTEKFVDEEPDEEFDGSFDDEEYDDESYDDSEYSSEDDNAYLDDEDDYEPDKSMRSDDDSDYEDEEEGEEDEDEEDESDDETSDDGNKKKIIIGAAVLLVLLLLGGGMFAVTKAGKKTNVNKETVAIEQTNGETDITIDEDVPADDTKTAMADDDEVSIDVETEDEAGNAVKTAEVTVETDGEETKATVNTEDESGLKVEVEEAPQSTFAANPADGAVTVNIGDVGRKNPFAPTGGIEAANADSAVASKEPGLDFEVIEPPQLSAEDPEISKLLNTKVAGILYDQIRPSAIININGIDQLVRIGDTISGFEIVLITKNKVIIQSGNNVYRASVGQPLNAEKIVNTVEISNLKSKFWGSEPHTPKNF
ncbi:MAG: hypothetical protein K6E29_08020 [Cyanobacteria bacterium RUI128]|nr:hypothetical protein [Cyanobacteria bacterium RUI128]